MTDAEILAEAKAKMQATANPLIVLNEQDFTAVKSSGTALKTSKAKDLRSGIYAIVELKDVEKKSKAEVIDSLIDYYGEEPKWSGNLPEVNVSGFCRLKLGETNVSVYLNNSLFNLMIEQKALIRDDAGQVTLSGQTFKV